VRAQCYINVRRTAGVRVNGANAITIQAGPNDVVHLRGLDLNGGGVTSTASGISFVSGGALHVQSSLIYGFNKGIDFAPTGASELYVSNVTLRNNAYSAIWVHPQATATAMLPTAYSRIRSQPMIHATSSPSVAYEYA